MAFELSFAPEFFVAAEDAEDIEPDPARPISVFQAICVMPREDWNRMCREVFGRDGNSVNTQEVMDKIRETNTCRDLRSPVEVYIDPEGYHTVRVYDAKEND